MTTIFSDGFESGNFSAWTGTLTDSPATATVENVNPHHGSYNAKFVCPTEKYAVAYKDFTAAAIVYARCYVKFNTLPVTTNQFIDFFGLQYTDWQNGVLGRVVKTATGLRWALRVVVSGVETIVTEASDSTINTGTWYCIEVLRDVTNDLQKLYVDGTLEVSGTVNIASNTTRIQAGYDGSSCTATQTLYLDCVVVADAYIGPESGAILKTVADALSLSDSVLRHKPLLPIADSLGLADALLRGKTFTISDVTGLADAVLRNKTLTVTDAVAVAETIKALKTLMITDQIQLAELLDVLKGGILKSVIDSVGLADSALVNKILTLADSLTLLDSASTPSRVLQALDAAILADSARVNKVLQISDTVSVAEVVEVGAGGVKKTRLFLVLGDLAVQLTGD